MFHATVYRVVPEAQALSKLKYRPRGGQACLSHATHFVRAYDSAELAAFCCTALWAQPSTTAATARRRLVRETIEVALSDAAAAQVMRIPRSAEDVDEEGLWARMHEAACAKGLFCVYALSPLVPGRYIALLDVEHPSISHALAYSQRFIAWADGGRARSSAPLRAA